MQWANRNEERRGADVASANDLTLGTDGNLFALTGTTTVNRILTTNWQSGSKLTISFGNLTIAHNVASGSGYAGFKLAGSANFSPGANGGNLTVRYNGTQFEEISRTTF
jgi:hypothetical protein